MIHQRYFFFFLFTLLSLKCFSQTDILPINDGASKKIFFSMDYRNSFIRSSEAHIIGFRAGLEIGQKYRFGLGYHYLPSEIIRSIPVTTPEGTVTNTNAQVHLHYGSVSGEYILINTELWQLSTPLVLGAGASYYEPPSNHYPKTDGQFTLFIEPALIVQYNIIPFIGIGTGIGYRFMPIGDPNLRSTFATPVYDIRLKLLLNEVSEALFPNGLWKKKQAE